MRYRKICFGLLALISAAGPATVHAASSTTNSSGTITTGGTFQSIAASNTSRLSLDFQNRSGNGDNCYLYFGTGTATLTNSIKVTDSQEYLRADGAIPSDEIQATCAGNGDAYYLGTQ